MRDEGKTCTDIAMENVVSKIVQQKRLDRTQTC